MADTAIHDLAALTGANLASGDEVVVVDVSDTTMSADGTNKKMTATELAVGLGALTLGAYTDYTPTIAQNGTRATSTLVGRYIQIGKRVHAWGKATISNAGTAGNVITVTLPVSANASVVTDSIGTGFVFDSGTALYSCVVRCESATTLSFVDPNTTSGNKVGQTPSFAVASGDSVSWNVTYEAA